MKPGVFAPVARLLSTGHRRQSHQQRQLHHPISSGGARVVACGSRNPRPMQQEACARAARHTPYQLMACRRATLSFTLRNFAQVSMPPKKWETKYLPPYFQRNERDYEGRLSGCWWCCCGDGCVCCRCVRVIVLVLFVLVCGAALSLKQQMFSSGLLHRFVMVSHGALWSLIRAPATGRSIKQHGDGSNTVKPTINMLGE